MKKALLATLCLVALALCFSGAVGLWQLRVAATSAVPAILDYPLLRLASMGLFPQNTQTPIDLAAFSGQIRDRLVIMIALGLGLLVIGGSIFRFARRRTGQVVRPGFQA